MSARPASASRRTTTRSRPSINSVNRTWNDLTFPEGDPRRGNFVPDCDLANRALNGECGAWANQNFGGLGATTRYADDALLGYGARSYNWDFTTEVQHELSPGVSMTAGYYRNWFGNHLVTDNTLVTPADFDPFCITAPSDSRLPGGGGYQVCGLYDVTPALFGQVNSVITQADNYGELKRVNDFFNVTAERPSQGGPHTRWRCGHRTQCQRRLLRSGLARRRRDGASRQHRGRRAGILSTPTPFTRTTIDGQSICRIVTPFKGQTQVKGFLTYPLPYDFVVSAVFQNISGPAISANYAASNA